MAPTRTHIVSRTLQPESGAQFGAAKFDSAARRSERPRDFRGGLRDDLTCLSGVTWQGLGRLVGRSGVENLGAVGHERPFALSNWPRPRRALRRCVIQHSSPLSQA